MSSSEWNSYILNDILITPLRNGVNKPSKVRGMGYKMVNMGELFANPIIRRIDMERVPLSSGELANCLLQEGDLLFARQSLTVDGAGKCSLFLGDDELTTFEGHLIRARPNYEFSLPRYLYYYFQSHHGINQIKSIVTVTAAAGIRSSDLGNLEIPLPPIENQHRIADILSALDDKIELNRQTNATLEAIAQAIFKQWFVDFNYPGATGELVDSELGLIPPGWRVGKLGEVCEFAYGKALRADNRVQGEYPVVGSSGIVDTHNEYLVEGPGIVIGRKGTIGEVIWLHENFFPIDTTFYIKDLLDVNGLYFHYFLLQQQDFKKIGSDSAVPGLNRNQAYDSFVIIPEVDAVQQFTDLVQVIFAKIFNNSQQTTTLTQIRDSLLPKLMCGEIAV